jgi:hypothetical protein
MLDFRPAEAPERDKQIRRMQREKIPPETEAVQRLGEFWSSEPLPNDQRARLEGLRVYLTPERLTKIVVPLIAGHSAISMRILDWLVINYAKSRGLTLLSERGDLVQLYHEYRSALHYWQRSLFDAFRRGPRVFLRLDGWTYSTTVGQLNYLYWYQSMGALSFVAQQHAEIEAHMAARIALCRNLKRKARDETGGGKRCALVDSTPPKCQIVISR